MSALFQATQLVLFTYYPTYKGDFKDSIKLTPFSVWKFIETF